MRPHRHPRERGALDLEPIEHGAQVCHEVRVLVGGRIGRRIRLAVAARVVRDGPEAGPGQGVRTVQHVAAGGRQAVQQDHRGAVALGLAAQRQIAVSGLK